MSPNLFFLFSLFSLASATGHLRLELTSSHNFRLQLGTSFSIKPIYLTMGNTQTVSFHPKVRLETLDVSFFKSGKAPQHNIFSMQSPGVPTIQTFILDEIVLMVDSIFECDDGFIGEYCQEVSTTTTTTTTTTTISTSTTEIKTITTTTTQLSTGSPSKLQQTSSSSTANTVLCSALIFLIVILLVLIVIVYLFLRPKQPEIIIQSRNPTTESTQIDMNESGIYSADSQGSTTYSSSSNYVVVKF